MSKPPKPPRMPVDTLQLGEPTLPGDHHVPHEPPHPPSEPVRRPTGGGSGGSPAGGGGSDTHQIKRGTIRDATPGGQRKPPIRPPTPPEPPGGHRPGSHPHPDRRYRGGTIEHKQGVQRNTGRKPGKSGKPLKPPLKPKGGAGKGLKAALNVLKNPRLARLFKLAVQGCPYAKAAMLAYEGYNLGYAAGAAIAEAEIAAENRKAKESRHRAARVRAIGPAKFNESEWYESKDKNYNPIYEKRVPGDHFARGQKISVAEYNRRAQAERDRKVKVAAALDDG